MDFKIIEKVKSSIDKFDDAEFYSVSEQSVIVKNTKNQSLWRVPFSFNESGTLVFSAKEAEQVKEGVLTETEKFQKNTKDLKTIIRGIFCENKEEAIKDLKAAIAELPMVDNSVFEQKESQEYKLPSSGIVEAVKTIYDLFGRKVTAYQESLKQFKDLGTLFEQDNTPKKENILDPEAILEAYSQKLEAQKSISESLELISNFYEGVKENFDEEVSNFIIEGFDLSNADKIKIEAAKAVTMAKRQFGDAINITEDAKKLISLYEQTIGENNIYLTEAPAKSLAAEMPQKDGFQFLKFRQGIFTESDVEQLEKEFDKVISRAHFDLSEDEFKLVNDLRTKITYMNRTKQFDDEVIAECIKMFNGYFAKPARDFVDGEKALGWRGAADQRMRGQQGTAIQLGA